MVKILIGFLGAIALMRYLSEGVITDDQRAQIEQNAKALFQTGVQDAEGVVETTTLVQ